MVRDKPLHNFLFETDPTGFYDELYCGPTPWINVCVLLHLVRRYQPTRFLEVGSHRGHTTRILADKFPSMAIVTVDPGDSIPVAARSPFQANEYLPQDEVGILVRECSNVAIHNSGFHDVDWGTERFNMIFIDGDHRAAAVFYDTQLALKLVTVPGVIIWHGYNCIKDVNIVLGQIKVPGTICSITNTWIAYYDTHG